MAELPDIRVIKRAPYADLYRAVGVEQPFLDGATKGGAVMELGSEIIIAGVTMGVEMYHAHGALTCDRPKDG